LLIFSTLQSREKPFFAASFLSFPTPSSHRIYNAVVARPRSSGRKGKQENQENAAQQQKKNERKNKMLVQQKDTCKEKFVQLKTVL